MPASTVAFISGEMWKLAGEILASPHISLIQNSVLDKITILAYFLSPKPTKVMAKDKPAKEKKKEPAKSLKEKRAAKQEKKSSKRD